MMAVTGRLRVRRWPRDRKGQALVEFVLIAPILMLLILGLVDFARAWNTYQVITDAAREGARTVAVDNDAGVDSATTVINAALARAGLDTSPTVVDIDIDPGSGRGTTAVVNISYAYTFGWVGRLVSLASGTNQVRLKTSFSMRNE